MKKTRKLIAVLFSTMFILSMSMQTFAATKYFTLSNGDLCATLDYSRATGYVKLELKIVKDSAGYNKYNGKVKASVYYVDPNGKHVSSTYEDFTSTAEKTSAKIEKTFPGSTINAINASATVNNKTISFTY